MVGLIGRNNAFNEYISAIKNSTLSDQCLYSSIMTTMIKFFSATLCYNKKEKNHTRL
jgi:hypothetical protein